MCEKILDKKTNTGYAYTKLFANNGKLILRIYINGSKDGLKKTTKTFSINTSRTYRDALKLSVSFLSELLDCDFLDDEDLNYEKGLNYIHNLSDDYDHIKNMNPLNDSVITESVLVDDKKRIRMIKIKENRSSYRVNIRPDNNGHENGLTFPFIAGDEYSRSMALEKAVKYRDSMYMRSFSSNTGYRNIKVSRDEDGVSLFTSITYNKVAYNKTIKLTDNMSYKKALKISLEFLSSVINIGVPDDIIYDYGLSTAYGLGYKGHNDDPKNASLRILVGMTITCPDTKETGKVRAIIDGINIAVECDVTKKMHFITNDLLYMNRITNNVDVIEKLEKSLKENDNLTQYEQSGILDVIDKLEYDIAHMHGQINGGDKNYGDKNSLKENLKSKINKTPGLNIIKKKPKIINHNNKHNDDGSL